MIPTHFRVKRLVASQHNFRLIEAIAIVHILVIHCGGGGRKFRYIGLGLILILCPAIWYAQNDSDRKKCQTLETHLFFAQTIFWNLNTVTDWSNCASGTAIMSAIDIYSPLCIVMLIPVEQKGCDVTIGIPWWPLCCFSCNKKLVSYESMCGSIQWGNVSMSFQFSIQTDSCLAFVCLMFMDHQPNAFNCALEILNCSFACKRKIRSKICMSKWCEMWRGNQWKRTRCENAPNRCLI